MKQMSNVVEDWKRKKKIIKIFFFFYNYFKNQTKTKIKSITKLII